MPSEQEQLLHWFCEGSMSLEACTRLPGALEQKFASKMCQVRIAIATAISDKFAGSETSWPCDAVTLY